jgi:Glycosyl transferase family 2
VRCPTLSELPPPPPGKTGWPWTEAGSAPPAGAPRGASWPRVCLVTPSYNQGDFLEGAIRSVLLQGYPDLEYVIIDGGSSDRSVEVIRKYEPWLTYWTSEPDRGQSHAINKGFARCQGHIYNWLCTDDLLLPNALLGIAQLWAPGIRLILGRTRVVNQVAGSVALVAPSYSAPIASLLTDILIPQPSAFVCNEKPMVREDMYYVMDWELLYRMLRATSPEQIVRSDAVWAQAVIHPGSKSSGTGEVQMWLQTLRTRLRLADELPRPQRDLVRLRLRRREQLGDLFELFAAGGTSIPALCRLALRRPLLLTTRPFWGALRRAPGRRRGGAGGPR